MRNATTIAAVQRALGVSPSGSADTVSDQRRAAQLRIELRRARILALTSKRLTASPSPLAVDGQAAWRPPDGRARECVPPAPPEAGGQLATPRHRGRENSNPSASGPGGETSVNKLRQTDRPTVNERLRFRIARPAGRRSAQPNIETATGAKAVLAAAGRRDQGASLAAARRAAARAHDGALDTQRGFTS